MKRNLLLLAGGTTLAFASALAWAQNGPESLLPPGFERPAPKPTRSATPPPVAPTLPRAASETGSSSSPVIQPLPGDGAVQGGSAASAPAAAAQLPSLKDLENLPPDQLDELLGLKPKFDMPPAARRSLNQVGILATDEGGFAAGAVKAQNASLVRALLDGNNGTLVSRWGHILLRRALASRLDAPGGINPADFAAMRAGLLVRMGEGEAARALVQDVDAGNYTPALTQAAMDAYALTADITGICPVVAIQGGVRKDADWRVLRAICDAFEGESTAAMAQLDRMQGDNTWPKIDMLLAQKYAGAAGKARRAVKIEWDGAQGMTPWRYALTIAVGLEPPAGLMRGAADRYSYTAATAPMLPLTSRAAGADRAAAAGILSSAAMVDLYSQIYAQDDITGPWAKAAASLRTAYVGGNAKDRLAAMQSLWESSDTQQRYSRQVLTAYAAARLPVDSALSAQAADIITSMLAAGLDANALRWAPQADAGTQAWALLALAAPERPTKVDAGMLDSFYDKDPSDGYRKTRFLLAGLAGLGRVDDAASRAMASKLGIDLGRQTRWTQLIDQAAAADNQAMVALLAGLGMQGNGWDKMTSVHLYHIVAALNRVGLDAEARMIAAEAVARG